MKHKSSFDRKMFPAPKTLNFLKLLIIFLRIYHYNIRGKVVQNLINFRSS